ncbi:MAG: PAS domain-containing protein [Bacteroidia bacterium]|nr:PAS domain-containing protein [Bacteroidia bacterium]
MPSGGINFLWKKNILFHQNQLTYLLEKVNDAIFALDTQENFIFLNQEAERLLHRERKHLLGRNIWQVFPEAIGSTFFAQYAKAREENMVVAFQEYYPPLATWFYVKAIPPKKDCLCFSTILTASKKRRSSFRRAKPASEAYLKV